MRYQIPQSHSPGTSAVFEHREHKTKYGRERAEGPTTAAAICDTPQHSAGPERHHSRGRSLASSQTAGKPCGLTATDLKTRRIPSVFAGHKTKKQQPELT